MSTTNSIKGLILIISLLMIISCGNTANNNTSIISNIIKGVDFGDNFEYVRNEILRQNISFKESSMDGGEILIFLQNTSNDSVLLTYVMDYVSSEKFSPEYPLNKVLPKVKIYNLDLHDLTSGMAKNDWEPAEIYFYDDILFGFSSFIPSEIEKDTLLSLFRKKEELDQPNNRVSLNKSEENKNIYLNINVANNLYLYDKNIYPEVKSYVINNLKNFLDEEN